MSWHIGYGNPTWRHHEYGDLMMDDTWKCHSIQDIAILYGGVWIGCGNPME